MAMCGILHYDAWEALLHSLYTVITSVLGFLHIYSIKVLSEGIRVRLHFYIIFIM